MADYPPKLPPPRAEGSFGIPGHETQKALEVDAYKELVNKLAWAIGTAYGRPYANRGQVARQIALDLAAQVVEKHGWPARIRKEK